MVKTIYEILDATALWFQVIPVIALLYRLYLIKNVKNTYVIFGSIFLLHLVCDIIMLYLFMQRKPNLWLSNITIYATVPLFYLLFRSLNFSNKRIFNAISGTFTVVMFYGFYNTFLEGKITEYKDIFYALTCLIYLLWGILYFFDFALFSDLNLTKFPLEIFLVSLIIVYYVVVVSVYFIDSISEPTKYLVWIVRNSMLIAYCLLSSVLIVKHKAISNG